MTTLVAAVGADLAAVVRRVSGLENVTVEPYGDSDEEATGGDLVSRAARLASVWRRAATHGSVYTLVDADPLQPVVDAWARRLTGRGDDLELAIGLVGDATPAADFLFVPPGLPAPEVHWYTDHLRRLAPTRIVLVEPHPRSVLGALADLPYGPPLPPPSELARLARNYVPTAQPSAVPPTTSPSVVPTVADRTYVR